MEELSLFRGNDGSLTNPFRSRETTTAVFLKQSLDEGKSTGFNGILRGYYQGWSFTDLNDQRIPSGPVDHGNAVILAAHVMGKILFCYNETCQGRELYSDMACAKVNHLDRKVTRLTAKAEKMPTPLQAVQIRLNPTPPSFVGDESYVEEATTAIADFATVTINLIARANTDLTDSEDPRLRKCIPRMVKKYLKPIPLSEVQYTGVRCNIIAFWRHCKTTNAILLYSDLGSIELMVESRFFLYLTYVEKGCAIFTGVTAIDEGLPQGKTLTWGSEDTFFTPIQSKDYDLYDHIKEEPQFRSKIRLDFPVYGYRLTSVEDYKLHQIYTVPDLAFIHARVLNSNGSMMTEESWYATVVPQVLGKGYMEVNYPLMIVRVTSYLKDSKVLTGTNTSDDLMGAVYIACNLSFQGKIMGSIPELHFQGTRPKQRMQSLNPADKTLRTYAKKFHKTVMDRIAAIDEQHQQSQQRLQVQMLETPKAVKPRRTLLIPSVSPAATLFSDLSVSFTTSTSTASHGLSVPASETSTTTQESNRISTAGLPETPPDQPASTVQEQSAQAAPPVERPTPKPIFDDDDDDALVTLGIKPSQPQQPTETTSQNSSQQRRAESRALATKFSASKFFDSSSSEDDSGDDSTTKLIPYTRAPDENAVAPNASFGRKRSRFIEEEEQDDSEAEDYQQSDEEDDVFGELQENDEEDEEDEEAVDLSASTDSSSATTSSSDDEDEVTKFIFQTSTA